MLPRLLEEYEMSGANDPSRELDIKNIAAVTYGGTFLSLKQNQTSDCRLSLSQYCGHKLVL